MSFLCEGNLALLDHSRTMAVVLTPLKPTNKRDRLGRAMMAALLQAGNCHQPA